MKRMRENRDWLEEVQRLARTGDPQALALFARHRDEAVELLFGEKAAAGEESLPAGGLFEQDTREIAQIVAKWSAYAAPLDEDVLSVTVDVARLCEPPLVTARTEGGEVLLFDVDEGSRANEEHLEDCRHVEASWADWQDEPGFIGLFCDALTAAMTIRGLPAPEYIR